jgi:hypothetical protein
MTDYVPEHPRSPRPVRGTAGLRGVIMQADIIGGTTKSRERTPHLYQK